MKTYWIIIISVFVAVLLFIGGVVIGYSQAKVKFTQATLTATQQQAQDNVDINNQIQKARSKNEICKSILDSDLSDCLH